MTEPEMIETPENPAENPPEAPALSWQLPATSLLERRLKSDVSSVAAGTRAATTAVKLQTTLAAFGINAEVMDWSCGPTVTLFKLQLPAGTKASAVANLSADLSRALMVDSARIYSPVPGTLCVGIEVPNKERATVHLSDVLSAVPDGSLQLPLGKDVENKSRFFDLARGGHLLIGGTTDSGKGVQMHAMITSLLMQHDPGHLKLLLIDPKRVEYARYTYLPHLLCPPVNDCHEAAAALSWAVAEAERRLKVLQKAHVRGIADYNALTETDKEAMEDAEPLPRIVIAIDALADLMMIAGKEAEFPISRIAQLGRTVGIHLIIATQRPDARIITGLIKANIPNRIAFKVPSGIHSRIIIDQTGAESLISGGDMLFLDADSPRPARIQGCYVLYEDIVRVAEAWRAQGEAVYDASLMEALEQSHDAEPTDSPAASIPEKDPLLWEAAELVVSENFAATSLVQRKLNVGYARATRIMDELEELGVVGPSKGSHPRDVLLGPTELIALKAKMLESVSESPSAARPVSPASPKPCDFPSGTPAAIRISELLEDAVMELSKLPSPKVKGISTGFEALDSLGVFLQPGDFAVVASRPAVGKTSFALNMALSAAKGGFTVLYISTESTEEALTKRILSIESGFDCIRSGEVTDGELLAVIRAAKELSRLNLFLLDDKGIRVSDIAPLIQACPDSNTKGRIVFVDCLQLMMPESSFLPNRAAEFGELARNLKLLAKDLGLPVVALSHLSRSIELRAAEDRAPHLSDLRESGSIEQDADIVMFLDRSMTEEEAARDDRPASGSTNIIVAKHRNGPVGTAALAFNPRTGAFGNLPT